MSEKQIIEEMASTLGGCHTMPNCKVCCAYIGSTNCFDKTRAERLYNEGYRKESDTAREILDELLKEKNLENVYFTDENGDIRNRQVIRIEKIKDLAEKYGVEVER